MNQELYQKEKHVNAPSKFLIGMLAMGLISTVNGQVTCTTQCCWVAFIWKKFGKTATLNSAGCGNSIPGVTYSGSVVTQIDWNDKGLINSIPSEISKLTSLEIL